MTLVARNTAQVAFLVLCGVAALVFLAPDAEAADAFIEVPDGYDYNATEAGGTNTTRIIERMGVEVVQVTTDVPDIVAVRFTSPAAPAIIRIVATEATDLRAIDEAVSGFALRIADLEGTVAQLNAAAQANQATVNGIDAAVKALAGDMEKVAAAAGATANLTAQVEDNGRAIQDATKAVLSIPKVDLTGLTEGQQDLMTTLDGQGTTQKWLVGAVGLLAAAVAALYYLFFSKRRPRQRDEHVLESLPEQVAKDNGDEITEREREEAEYAAKALDPVAFMRDIAPHHRPARSQTPEDSEPEPAQQPEPAPTLLEEAPPASEPTQEPRDDPEPQAEPEPSPQRDEGEREAAEPFILTARIACDPEEVQETYHLMNGGSR